MKRHANDFKERIAMAGRELHDIITYSINGENKTIDSESLNRVVPSYQGNILKSVMKELTIDSNVYIPIGTIINYKFGVKMEDNTYEYINFGNYKVISSEKAEDTKSYDIQCYDMMINSMVLNEQLEVEYPITIRDYIKAVCEKIDIKFASENDNFRNYDKLINEELYLNLGYTYRDIFDQLAQVTASTICINDKDELEIRYINNTNDYIDSEYFKDSNAVFGEKYGPINSIVLSRSAESDNVYIQDIKNKFNKNDFEYINATLIGNEILSSSTNKTIVMPLESDKTYTIQKPLSGVFKLGTTKEYPIPKSKNLFNLTAPLGRSYSSSLPTGLNSNIVVTSFNVNNLEFDTLINGYLIVLSNDLVLEPNTQYTLSYYRNNSGLVGYSRYYIYNNNNGVYSIANNGTDNTSDRKVITFTTGSTGVINIAFGSDNQNAGMHSIVSDIQLEKGVTATDYKPFVESTPLLQYIEGSKTDEYLTIITNSNINYLLINYYDNNLDISEQLILDKLMVEIGDIPSEYESHKINEIKIIDNQIMNWNDRTDYLLDIFEQLKGLEYYTNDYISTGIGYFDLCDGYYAVIDENIYYCVMFNNEFIRQRGLSENIYTEIPEETVTEYDKSAKDDRTLEQVYLIVNKQSGTIEGLVSQVNSQESSITELKQQSDSFNINIQRINNNIENLDENLSNNTKNIETLSGTVKDMNFRFETDGMTISSTQSENSQVLDNFGVRIYNFNTLNAIFNHNGVGVKKLIAIESIQLSPFIFKSSIKDGKKCIRGFYLENLAESLEDLNDRGGS